MELIFELINFSGKEISGEWVLDSVERFGLHEIWRDGFKELQFDGAMFWSLLVHWKFFWTTGIEIWDKKMTEFFPEMKFQEEKEEEAEHPEHGKRYTGYVIEWRRSYGFLHCADIQGKIFIEGKNILGDLKMSVGDKLRFFCHTEPTNGNKCAFLASM